MVQMHRHLNLLDNPVVPRPPLFTPLHRCRPVRAHRASILRRQWYNLARDLALVDLVHGEIDLAIRPGAQSVREHLVAPGWQLRHGKLSFKDARRTLRVSKKILYRKDCEDVSYTLGMDG
jgi:hypothetical protein